MTILKRTLNNEPLNEKSLRGMNYKSETTNKEQILKRINQLKNIKFYSYSKYISNYHDGKIESYYTQDIKENSIVSLSDLTLLTYPDLSDLNNIYIMHDYCILSDYGGSLINKSNAEVLINEYNFHRVINGYRTLSCIISIKDLVKMPEEESENIIDILENMNYYLLIDEEDYSEQVKDAIEEEWNTFTKDDFIKEINSKFNPNNPDNKINKELQIKGDLSIRELFDDLSDRSNTYWINECGYSMYIDINEIVKSMTINDFNTYFETE